MACSQKMGKFLRHFSHFRFRFNGHCEFQLIPEFFRSRKWRSFRTTSWRTSWTTYFDIADFEDTDAFAGNQLRGSHGADSDFDDDEDFAEASRRLILRQLSFDSD
ncbi:hypothetical protein ACFX12_005377 [Malus domestica]